MIEQAQPDYVLETGHLPIIVTIPHDGRALPEHIATRMTQDGLGLPDTDFDVRLLYEFAAALGCSVLAATWSRYVVDLNRSPAGTPLYPGQRETGVCPVTTFAGEPIYIDGAGPDTDAIAARVERYWQPWHDALAAEIARLHGIHGQVLVWEAHSIRSQVPALFEGTLPDFNFGTDGGRTCPPDLLAAIASRAREYGWRTVVDERFQGGYTTRHYARPEQRIWTVQLELSQATYRDESLDRLAPDGCDRVRTTLRNLLALAEHELTAL
ncbi:MAG: N-formylglutamate deformylase [Pseudomonadota bacterium]